MASGEFTDKTRSLIRLRAAGRCEVCGLTGAYQIHHRQPRGMGGSGAEPIRSCANGLFVHDHCHRKIEANRTKSYLLGHLVHRWSSPEDTHVRLWDGWWYLTADGQRKPGDVPHGSPDR